MWTMLVFAVCSSQILIALPWSGAEGSAIPSPEATAGSSSSRPWSVVNSQQQPARKTVLTFQDVEPSERFPISNSFQQDDAVFRQTLYSDAQLNIKHIKPEDNIPKISASDSSRSLAHEDDFIDTVDIANNRTPAPAATPAPCADYHNLNTSAEKCAFIRGDSKCANEDGFINYLQVIYCTFPKYRVLGFIILAVWLLYLLIALGVTAEEFFCPDLEVMAKTLKMSQNIAGVTLLAFGNGAPDIFSAIAAITNATDGDAGLAIGALFGAGIFVTSIVAGSIAITRPFKMVERPFLRDNIFYLAAAFWTFLILYRGQISFPEAIGYIALYLLYVVVVFVGRKIYQTRKRNRLNREINENEGQIDGYFHNDYIPPPPVLDDSLRNYASLDPTAVPSPISSINSTVVPSINSSNGDITVRDRSINTTNAPLLLRAELTATQRLAMASILNVDQDIARSITRQPSSIYPESETDETKPLLGGNRQEPPPGQIKEFLIGVCPVDIQNWSEKAWYSKIWEIIKSPLIFCLKLTIPVVDYEEPKHNWNRLLNILNLLLAPTFCAFVTKGLTKTITGNFQVWALVLPISVILAAVVFLTSKPDKQPIYHWAFSYIGFVVAILWIYSTANEIVNVLQMFGIEFQINDAILGLTVLAWGNSIGDLVSDITMAKQGFPTMGMSACFGGPMFNMLLGVGIACTITTIRDGGTFVLVTNKVQMVLAIGLAASLLSSMFIMLITRFHATKWYGIYLYILYIVVLVTAILVEVGVIPWE